MPTLDHLIYIPGILLLGLAIGFRVGAQAARSELERQRRERMK